MANNFLDTIIHDLPLIVNEIEQESFLKFLNYLKTSYLKPTHAFFLGKISNFQLELLGNWYPQLSNNVSESLNAVLQNCYKRGFINRSALAEGLHSFYSDRRDKYRVFMNGQKVNKRNKSDLTRFEKLKFISIKLSEIIYNPENFYYPGFVENVFLRHFSNTVVFRSLILMNYFQIHSLTLFHK